MKTLPAGGAELPKYERVMDFIIRNIRNGVYPDGSSLPSELDLAVELDVSRATVREALSLLSRRNVIFKSRGRRSVVNAPAIPGRSRSLRFGWISRDPFACIMPVYLEIYTALQKAALGINANLLFLPLLNPKEEEWGCSMLDTLDGVFLAGVRSSTLIPRLADRLEAMQNVIEIDDVGDTPAKSIICVDNYLAGKMAAEYLVARNRRTVVFVSNRSAFYRGFHDRIRGVLDGFAQRRQAPILINCDDSEIGSERFGQQLTELLQHYPDLDTVWHATDAAALRIRRQLEMLAPREEGFYRSAGVDGISSVLAGENYHLSLQHPTGEIARLAFQTMLGFTTGERPDVSVHLLPPALLPWREP